jgi:hypothetical protein
MVDPIYGSYVFHTMSGRSKYALSISFPVMCVIIWYLRRCIAEDNTVHREGAKLSFFKGDGVVKNVPEDKAAVFEVCLDLNSTVDQHFDVLYRP